MKKSYRQGFYRPMFPEKYDGDPTGIVYRSSWEYKFMGWLDRSNACIRWSSEETIIPYRSPVDGKIHRYFVDFKITLRQSDGSTKTYLIEVKPYAQTLPPKNRKNKIALMEAVATYQVNQAKWAAATEYCRQNGWEFKTITEKELAIK